MGGLFVRRVGQGPLVVLLHGAVLVGELTWREQLPLAERWMLVIVERAGYGRSRISPGEDLDADAPLVADLLEQGAHLVGQSSGAVAAMLAAAQRPEAVLSLTLSEPPAHGRRRTARRARTPWASLVIVGSSCSRASGS